MCSPELLQYTPPTTALRDNGNKYLHTRRQIIQRSSDRDTRNRIQQRRSGAAAGAAAAHADDQ